VEARGSLEALAAHFDLAKLSRTPARFDPADLERLNARLVHEMNYSDVKERLAALNADSGEAFWNAVRDNLVRVRDVAEWRQLIDGPVAPVIEDAEFARAAADLLPEGPLDGTSWSNWTGAVKDATGRKGKDLFMPLRLALTGQARGPEMAVLLPLIGADTARARLLGQAR